MSAFNNDGKDSSAINLFAKSKWNLVHLTCCYYLHVFKMSTHLHIQEENVNIMSFQDEKNLDKWLEKLSSQTYIWKEIQRNYYCWN